MSISEILKENPIISPEFYKVYVEGVNVINEDFQLGKENSEYFLEV